MSNFYRASKLNLSPLRLHSASTIQIPKNDNSFLVRKPYVKLVPLNLHSASSFHVPANTSTKIFNNRPQVCLTPLKSPIIQNYKTSAVRGPLNAAVGGSLNFGDLRRRVFPSISKCNLKRCGCCKHMSNKSNVVSSINGRRFNVKLASNTD